jgi:hypothetical protein
MCGGEHKLEELERQLSTAVDMATVLAIRSEALGVIAATRAASARVPVRAQREMRRRARLIGRARDLRRRAELIAGEILMLENDRGLRKEAGFQTRAGTNRKSLSDLGFKSWATAYRWQERARVARRARLNS